MDNKENCLQTDWLKMDTAKERQEVDVVGDVKRYAERTTCHGPGLIASSQSSGRRYCWALIFTAVMAVLIYQVLGQYIAFSSKAVYIDTKYQHPRNITMPSFTICNFNRFKRTALQALADRYGVSNSSLWQYMAVALASPAWLAIDVSNDVVVQIFEEFNRTEEAIISVDGSLDVMALLNELTFSYEDYLKNPLPIKLYCRWKGAKNRPCEQEMFATVFTEFGNCLTFQPIGSGPFVQTYPGPLGGLIAHFHLHNNESSEMSSPLVPGHLNVGFRLTVHERWAPPILTQNGAVINVGVHAYLSITLEEWKYWDQATECSPKHNHSLPACGRMCEAEAFNRLCGCVPVALMPFQKSLTRPCASASELFCLWNNSYNDPLFDPDYEVCASQCVQRCDELMFAQTVSSIAIPNPSIGAIMSHEDMISIKENLLVLNVFFESTRYRVNQQTRKETPLEALSTLGGQMGLMLGASTITALEFLEFVLFAVISRCKKRKEVMAASSAKDSRTNKTET